MQQLNKEKNFKLNTAVASPRLLRLLYVCGVMKMALNTDDYKTETVLVEYCSDMTVDEANNLIGKTVAKVEATEYGFELLFTDGSKVKASGGRWDGCSLGIACDDDV